MDQLTSSVKPKLWKALQRPSSKLINGLLGSNFLVKFRAQNFRPFSWWLDHYSNLRVQQICAYFCPPLGHDWSLCSKGVDDHKLNLVQSMTKCSLLIEIKTNVSFAILNYEPEYHILYYTKIIHATTKSISFRTISKNSFSRFIQYVLEKTRPL